MKISYMLLLPLFCFVLYFTDPAIAQDQTTQSDETVQLSKKMHEIWPIRPKIENVINQISENIPAQDRYRFKSAIRSAINYELLEQGSIEAMAEIFTAEELRAMIDFYGSKEGRSVQFKTDDYERALEPALSQMMDKALLELKLGKAQE